MKAINGYILFNELKTTNSGFSKWGFAQKAGKKVFIKELIDPVYPVYNDLLDPAVLARKREICQQFEERSQRLYRAINECSDGNLVYIEDFFRCGSHYYIVMEKVDAIDIDEVRRITAGDKQRVCKALIHCLDCMHRAGIVHADIKLDNILFRRLPSGAVTGKLIDFDNCFWESEPPRPDEEIHGDLVYMAPETFMMMQTEEGTIGKPIDVFALGIVFHQIFTGKAPAFDAEKYDYPFEAALDGAELGVSKEIPDEWRELIARMLKREPGERIALSEAEAVLKSAAAAAGGEFDPDTFLAPAGDLL